MRAFEFANEYGKTSDYGLKFLSFPVFSYGTEQVENIEISGRPGTLTQHTGIYSDTKITNCLEFASDSVSDYELKAQSIREWLKKTKKIRYADSSDRYYVVKKVDITDDTRLYECIGNITVVFTCSPSIYMAAGDVETILAPDEMLLNPYSVSTPVYRIIGEGVCKLTVNGKTVSANVGQNLTIDTEKMIAFRMDGTLQNTSITGDYEDLYLQEGQNTISYTEGFIVKIVPKWRILL